MKPLMVLAASLLLSIASLACGSTMSENTRLARLNPNSVAANGINQACGAVAITSVVVMCPAWLPGGNSQQWSGGPVGGAGGCGYLISIIGGSASAEIPFHVMFGGRCKRFSLAQAPDGRWPLTPNFTDYLELIGETPPRPGSRFPQIPIRLRVVERTTVAAAPAIVVQVAAYPNAGIQKGHYAIIWNRGTNGYELSFHYLPRGESGLPPTPAEVQALRSAATGMISNGS